MSAQKLHHSVRPCVMIYHPWRWMVLASPLEVVRGCGGVDWISTNIEEIGQKILGRFRYKHLGRWHEVCFLPRLVTFIFLSCCFCSAWMQSWSVAYYWHHRCSYHTYFIFRSVKNRRVHPWKSINLSCPWVYLMCGLFPNSLQFLASFHLTSNSESNWCPSQCIRECSDGKRMKRFSYLLVAVRFWSRIYLLSRDSRQ